MTTLRRTRSSALAAIAGGILFFGLETLGIVHDFWNSPIGVLTYENYNRLRTIPFLLLLMSWLGFAIGRSRTASRFARVSSSIVSGGLTLVAAGNIVEFWLIFLFQSRYVPFRQGGPNAWPGAAIGWMLFLLGCLVLLVGLVLFGIATLRAKVLPRWNGVPLLMGLSSLLGIASAALGPRIGLPSLAGGMMLFAAIGLGWVVLGYIHWSSPRAGRGLSDGTWPRAAQALD